MRMTSLALALAVSVLASGCAATGLPRLRLQSEPAIVVEGLRGHQTEQQWIREAKLATPPGCTVETIKVLTDSDAAFTYACFGSGPNAGSP
jgi:hypothetical protein